MPGRRQAARRASAALFVNIQAKSAAKAYKALARTGTER